MKDTVQIFFACDDNFVKYTVVALHSIIKHSNPERKYRVHILHTNISEQMMEHVNALANDNFEISFVDVTDYLQSISEKLPVRHYYTKTTYFRLFIADMFPEYSKALYVDSDTVTRTDIAKLYDTDIGDCYLAAAHEQAMEQVDVYGTYCERVVGVNRHSFFNAGLILINCEKFREVNMLDKFIDALSEYTFVVTQDEDYLNLLCKDRVYWLDQRWNTELTEGIVYPYDVKAEANIVHYIMANKPWHYESSYLGEIFWEAARETSVYGMLKAELDGYTDEQRERDRKSGENLYQMAIDETNKEDNYQNVLDKTRRAPDRVAVIKRIEQYEREGKFDVDVEDDPPSRTLMPDEIDYLRRSPIAKLKTYIAYLKARKFLNYIIKEKHMIIKEVRGLENLKSLAGGAVVTSNHFNAFDTFALHYAYLLAGEKKRKLYRVIREGNYTSFPGFYGYLMRHFYTLPLSSNVKTMGAFNKATDKLLRDGNLVLIYPEQSMWWNYRKPKPLKPGAYRFAVKNNVPVLPCFITMRDSDIMGADGYPVQEYTIHIERAIYPNASLSYKDAIAELMEKNSAVWREIYEREYSMPLVYTTEK